MLFKPHRIATSIVAALALGYGCVAAAATPSEQLLAKLRQAHPGTQFNKAIATEIPGLFEVWAGTNVIYISAQKPDYFLFGHIVDSKTMVDLTAQRVALAQALNGSAPLPGQQAAGNAAPQAPQAANINFADLPLADAIKTIRGTGERKLAVFSDPACGYCKKLEPELARLDNVTIYTFLVPIVGGPALPESVFCAANPQLAWTGYMLNGDTSALARPGTQCASPLARNSQLASRLRVNGTPTLFFADGARVDGMVGTEFIEQRFASVNPKGRVAAAR